MSGFEHSCFFLFSGVCVLGFGFLWGGCFGRTCVYSFLVFSVQGLVLVVYYFFAAFATTSIV